MSDISLTASMRSNLLSLQNTQSLMDQTQDRLSTGKKVNSAIDNPSSYYTAQSLTNRASDLESLLDSMGQGIQTIQAANEGIEAITSFVQQAKAVANSARDTSYKENMKPGTDAKKEFTSTAAVGTITAGDADIKVGDIEFDVSLEATDNAKKAVEKLNTAAQKAGVKNVTFSATDDNKITVSAVGDITEPLTITGTIGTADIGTTLDTDGTPVPDGTSNRTSYINQFNDILDQIDQLAADSSYKGVNLLKADESLKIVFNEDRSSSITIQGRAADTEGLGLGTRVDEDAWSTNEGVDATIELIDEAVSKLRDMASEFGNNYSIVQTRQDFTENLINVLEEGADNLTLADMNEESANMLALQTRQQLAINSLSLASQAAQSVLSLF